MRLLVRFSSVKLDWCMRNALVKMNSSWTDKSAPPPTAYKEFKVKYEKVIGQSELLVCILAVVRSSTLLAVLHHLL